MIICVVLLLNDANKVIGGSVSVRRLATISMRKLELLTCSWSSFGTDGASGGRAEAKFHSSSSLLTVAAAGAGAGAGAGDGEVGFEEEESETRAAKGSLA